MESRSIQLKGKRNSANFITNKHPLYIHTILDCVFGFVDYQTLKRCRLVCTVWQNTSKFRFAKQSRIWFASYTTEESEYVPILKPRKPRSRIRPFCLSDLDHFINRNNDTPFTAFGFHSTCVSVKIDDEIPCLTLFLRKHQNTIKDLKFCNLDFVSESGMLLGPNNLNSFIGENLTRLCVVQTFRKEDGYCISIEKLSSIPSIELNGVTLDLNGSLISPRELNLTKVKFIDNRKGVFGDISTSSFLDFSQMKKLFLGEVSLKLEITEAVTNLQEVTLERGNLISINPDTKWSIDILTLKRPILIDKTTLHVTDFRIFSGQVLYSGIPETVEILRILHLNNCMFRFRNLPEITFRNLKYFHFHNLFHPDMTNLSSLWSPEKLKAIPLFDSIITRCPNIVDLRLCMMRIPVSSIPKTVNRLALDRVILDGNETLNLQHLILGFYSCEKIQVLLKVLKPEKLTLNFGLCKRVCFMKPKTRQNTNSCGVYTNINDVIEILEKYSQIKTFTIGKFSLDESRFKRSRFSKLVDMLAEYYVFENDMGKAISYAEFEKSTKLHKYEEEFDIRHYK